MIRRDFVKVSLAAMAASAANSLTAAAAAATSACGPEEFPKAPGLTHYVSEFVVNTKYDDIPSDVIELGKKSLLDGFGLALAGSASTLAPLVRRYLEMLELKPGAASVIGTKTKVSPRFAAFTNGISIHADDYDDTQLSTSKDRVYGLLVHPTVTTLPPAFALSEMGRRSGKDLMLAYHVGVETECKIAEAIAPRHYNDGFHSTGTCGSFGSAAACAKLHGLDAMQTAYALGIVAAEAGGLRDNYGSMTKPFQAGHGAENGTVAADLASLGWTAASDILEGAAGFFQAAGGGFDPQAIVGRLGKPWTLANPGVSIKPFPSGSLTHPAMYEMQQLIREHHIKTSDVKSVDIGGNHNMVMTLVQHHPTTGLQGKFSMEFCLAILLVEGRAGLAQFTDAVVKRPDVQEMVRRVNFYVDPIAEAAGADKMTSLLKINMKDGTVISGRGDTAKGNPANPMSYADVAEKFRGCAEFAKWPKSKTEAVIGAVGSLESAQDTSALAAALTA